MYINIFILNYLQYLQKIFIHSLMYIYIYMLIVKTPRVMLVHGSCVLNKVFSFVAARGMNRFIVTVFSDSVWIVWDSVLCAEHLRPTGVKDC